MTKLERALIANGYEEGEGFYEGKERVKRFSRFINNGNLLNDRQLLYRGMTGKGEFTKKRIRQNRKPRDTKRPISTILKATRHAKYPEMPSRNKVAFASGKNHHFLKDYGPVHVIFPDKDSKLFTIPKDPYSRFSESRTSFLTVSKFCKRLSGQIPVTELEREDLDAILELLWSECSIVFDLIKLDAFVKDSREKLPKKYAAELGRFIIENFSELQNEIDKLTKINFREFPYTTLRTAVKSLNDILGPNNRLETYWADVRQLDIGNPEIGGMNEIMISGTYYWAARVNWFENFFEFSDGTWRHV